LNTGSMSPRSISGLVTSVAWSLGGKTTYALEGSVFNAGSSIQWLRDEVGLIGTASECDLLAESVDDNGGVYLVSAFTGLGAPRWDMYARGAIVGLTRGSTRAHIARAALEGIAYQVKDLLDAMEQDSGRPLSVLRVDGGASVSNFMMQFEADMLRKPIDRPRMVETTAFGAAFLAGLAAGVWSDIGEINDIRVSDRIFVPQMDEEKAKEYYKTWLRAVERSEKWDVPDDEKSVQKC
jgi:glycerol kinase